MKKVSIAIDGPSGAGKSTITRYLAAKMGLVYVDTGAMYRALGYYAVSNNIKADDRDAVVSMLKEIRLDISYDGGAQRIFLNDEDSTEKIRTPGISMAASAISAIPEVRAFLLRLQRSLAERHSVIMDGRDIGTVILPDADVKIFLTASPCSRAQRRYEELISKGQNVAFEDVLRELEQRDHNDCTRAAAPLKKADDAVLIDTTGLSLEDGMAAVENKLMELLTDVL